MGRGASEGTHYPATLYQTFMQPTQSMVDDILDRLSEYDPYIHKRNPDSVYIHFDNLPNGLTHKLRISNHEERAKYGYKWQIRLDGVPTKSDRKQYCKYFCTIDPFIKAFNSYYTQVRDREDYAKSRAKDVVWD
jgi:hypothetical protein